ncbi:Protein fem-1 C [Blomia tropicalis]|nr:Protein fem-1 C [Blomia tropicalis]
MDVKNCIFDAASTGDVSALIEIFKTCSNIEERRSLISAKLDGTTPVLVATRNGHCHMLRYLIEECNADVEQVGRVEFDGEKVENAPPLWCAAAVGCIDCVRLLMQNGAKINSTTSTNSTPLRAACFDGHFPIVKLLVESGADIELANRHGHTCLMISCYKKHYMIASYLIDHWAQINRQSVKGHTALHDCAESNCMEIMKLLVRNGAKFLKDGYGLTPLMTAALNGNKKMVKYLISVYKCPPEDEVNAYKLLGATFVDKFYDLSGAFEFWRHSLRKSFECSAEFLETFTNTNQLYKEAYDGTNEFRTEDDLNNIYCDPEQMKMQSLVIRDRIVGTHHPESYYFIKYRGAAFADSGRYDRCLSLWMYNLEQQQRANNKPLSDIIQNCFLSIIEVFSIMFVKQDPTIRMCDIFRVLRLAIMELLPPRINIMASSHSENGNDLQTKRYNRQAQTNIIRLFQQSTIEQKQLAHRQLETIPFNGNVNGLDRHFLIIIQLIGFACQLRPRLTSSEWMEFQKSIYEFLSFEPRSAHSYTLLHVLCIISCSELLSNFKTPLQDIFRLVVDVNSNLDSIDIGGNTALHFLFIQLNAKREMIDYLLKSGAHLDLRNEDGLNPLDYIGQSERNKYKVRFLSLQCLCTNVIVNKNIPFENELGDDLQNFIRMHQQRGYSANIYETSNHIELLE